MTDYNLNVSDFNNRHVSRVASERGVTELRQVCNGYADGMLVTLYELGDGFRGLDINGYFVWETEDQFLILANRANIRI